MQKQVMPLGAHNMPAACLTSQQAADVLGCAHCYGMQNANHYSSLYRLQPHSLCSRVCAKQVRPTTHLRHGLQRLQPLYHTLSDKASSQAQEQASGTT